MRIWDRGTYETHKFDDAKVEVTFHGERLRGRYGLFPLKKRKGEPPGKDWMIHRMDPPEDPDREPMPERLVPMLAKPSPHGLPPDDDRWAYEIKWDGVRALAYSEPGRIRFESRNRNDISGLLSGAQGAQPRAELAPRDPRRRDRRLRRERPAELRAPAGPDARRLRERGAAADEGHAGRTTSSSTCSGSTGTRSWSCPTRSAARACSELELQGAHWQTPDHVVGNGAAVLAASLENGLEGVVAKRLDSPYLPGRRSPCWLKVKNVAAARTSSSAAGCRARASAASGSARCSSASPTTGRLRYAGRVGTGFTEAELDRLAKVLEQREDSPFGGEPQPPRGAVCVEPTRVAEVEFTEWTTDGMMRHPSYKGLREEAPPSAFLDAGTPVRDGVEVQGRRAHPEGHEPRQGPLSEGRLHQARRHRVLHRDRAGDPRRTSRRRPLTRVRFPNGVEDKSFFEKQCPSHRPDWVAVAPVPLSKKIVEFCVCNDLPTLVWLANLAALELHTQMHRAEALGTPTMMVFDLDPGPPATIVECCRVALWLQGMFENLGLQAFPKTSGSKGLQVYVPLNSPGVTYDDTKGFARAVAELLEASEPDLVVARMNKDARKGKVFIDYSQNDEHKTTVCVYSLRARDRPTVSTPLEWDEVRDCLDGGDPAAARLRRRAGRRALRRARRPVRARAVARAGDAVAGLDSMSHGSTSACGRSRCSPSLDDETLQ